MRRPIARVGRVAERVVVVATLGSSGQLAAESMGGLMPLDFTLDLTQVGGGCP